MNIEKQTCRPLSQLFPYNFLKKILGEDFKRVSPGSFFDLFDNLKHEEKNLIWLLYGENLSIKDVSEMVSNSINELNIIMNELELKIRGHRGALQCLSLEQSESLKEELEEAKLSNDNYKADRDLSKHFTDNLGFSNRTSNALMRANIMTLRQLSSLSKNQLLMTNGIGVKAMNEIDRVLKEYDIKIM